MGRKCLFIVRHMLLGPMEPNLNWFWNFTNFEMIPKTFCTGMWSSEIEKITAKFLELISMESTFMNCNQILWIAINFYSLQSVWNQCYELQSTFILFAFTKNFLNGVVHRTTKVSLAKRVNQFTQKFHFFWLNTFVQPHSWTSSWRRWEGWYGTSEWVHHIVTSHSYSPPVIKILKS